MVQTQLPGAARVARLLRPAAERAGAWVSSEAAVRVAPGDVRAPAIVVATGEPPLDGVVDGVPLLIVELRRDHVGAWVGVPGAVVWGLGGDGVVTLRGGRVRAVGRDALLTVPGAPWLAVPATALLAAGA